jgi:hypothetical protein
LGDNVCSFSSGFRTLRLVSRCDRHPTGCVGEHMHKPLIALASAASVGLMALVAPVDANAGCYGCAVGLGILGGVAAGAIVGSAIANSPPPPPPGYYPLPPPGYPPPPPGAAYSPPPAYAQLAPGCHWGQERVWVEGYGYQRRTVQVCR